MAQHVFVQSFGCRASQADGSAIEASLAERGWKPVRDAAAADLVVLNTCTVTQSADSDARRMARNLKRDHPDVEILVTGCYAQRAPQELAQIEGVRWVVGNSHKTQIADLVSGQFASHELVSNEPYHGQILVGNMQAARGFLSSPVRDVRADRTRPNLKVQDGCSNRCSFCIIPSVRGPSRSASLESVIDQLRDLASRYVEVVISGINLGRWGRDLPNHLRFPDLVRAILDQTPLQRLRISSVEPMDWSLELFELMADNPRIAEHIHMPLQSGSDAVLRRMCRKYRTRHYASRLELAQRLLPNAGLGADVMTGFPQETDAEFEETVRFIDQQPFTYLHVFTYSERPGTAAESLAGAVPVPLRQQRTRVLRELSAKKQLEFCRRQVGKTLDAVTLEQAGVALTTNFLKVELLQTQPSNCAVSVAIGGLSHEGLRQAHA